MLLAVLVTFFNAYGQENRKTINDYIRNRRFDTKGKEIVEIIVPGKPPEFHREPVATPTQNAVILSLVPAFSWSFGCSPTSASMAAGYYDNNGYPAMYTGPANWGFMPMDNSLWGTVVINGETRDQCPLSATRNTVDGRTSRGHVDDYWVQYGSTETDPYIVNGWIQHAYSDCTGDYMGSNQSVFGSSDGSTTFTNYTDGSPLYNYTGGEPGYIDGCHGLRDFYESRGYVVVQNYSQYIYGWQGNTLGFTFDQYKLEIDNGRPVLIQVEGHTMLGYGYDNTGSVVYVHDTWDYNTHTMVWGGSYSGMAQYGVTVVQLAPPAQSIIANFSVSDSTPVTFAPVNLTDLSFGNPTSWIWNISPGTFNYVGGTSSSSQHPQVQFIAGGFYTISLTVSNGTNQDTETRTNCIAAIDCSNLSMPFSEDFSDGILPSCWSIIDHQGNGQVWQFNNPGGRSINTATASNGFAILDSDHYGDGNSQNADLVTPVLNFSQYSKVFLSFQHYFRSWEGSSGTLSYSINGGGTWTVIQSWTVETANPEIFSQNVSAQVAGQSNVRFKWNYTGTWGYYWAVDDISIIAKTPGLWMGTVSTDWNTPSNWDDGEVPSSATNVSISPNALSWPYFSGNFTVGIQCHDLTIPTGTNMTVSGDFTVHP
jgi:PKD repeat protein